MTGERALPYQGGCESVKARPVSPLVCGLVSGNVVGMEPWLDLVMGSDSAHYITTGVMS